MERIKFRSGWSFAAADCKVFRDWERGWISANEGAKRISENSGVSVSASVFIDNANNLGYTYRGAYDD